MNGFQYRETGEKHTLCLRTMALPKECKVEAISAKATLLCSRGAGKYGGVYTEELLAKRNEGLGLCRKRVKIHQSWKLEVRQFLLALVY